MAGTLVSQRAKIDKFRYLESVNKNLIEKAVCLKKKYF